MKHPALHSLLPVLLLCAFAARAAEYTAVFTRPAKQVPSPRMVDGPLLGNGGVGVTLGGPPEAQHFWIGKNDFWRRNNAQPMPVGVVEIRCPALAGASYRQELDLTRAEVRGVFTNGVVTVHTRSWVQADANLLVTEYSCEGPDPVTVSVRQIIGMPGEKQRTGTPDAELPGSLMTRKADTLEAHLPQVCLLDGSRVVTTVTRILGAAAAVEKDSLTFELKPGQPAWIVSSVMSDLDLSDSSEQGKPRAMVAGLTPQGMEDLSTRHRAWWKQFHSRSFIEIPDKLIEKHWVAALYTMASCSRPGQVAPGLWGNWTTSDQTMWHGDFHLNYNFQAPYYHVYAGNHVELARPLIQAINEYRPFGRAFAQKRGWKGVHYPIGIGPWGIATYPREKDLNQRSCAAYAALNFIWEYQYTQDTERLRTELYPYLREVAEFWEDYLKFEGGRYIVYKDAIHESHQTEDMNSLLSLGLVRFLFTNMLQMSADLGVDADKREKWRHILDHLSAFPTQEREGKTVFRYTESGMDWNPGNTLGIQHIFPAGAIGLDSDPGLLKISHNMIEAMARWRDYNGFSSWYTACVRVGYDPKTILKQLRGVCERHSLPNLLIYFGGGGIEGCGGFQAVNEMLLQSHEGVLRFFPVWPKELDAKFGGLRTVGAFLVSASLAGGQVTGVEIVSEKGRDLTVLNPWPGQKVQIAGRETVSGDRFTVKTTPGEILKLQPAN